MSNVPDESIVRRVVDVMQRDREFDGAKAGRKVATASRHRVDQIFAQLATHLTELLRRQGAQIRRRPDLGQQRIGARIAVGDLNHDGEILQNQDARPTTKSASFASS